MLTGQALFVDDVQLAGMLHAAFLRSDYAHARIKSIDASAARERPGVVAVYTAEDMGEDWAVITSYSIHYTKLYDNWRLGK